MGGGDRCFRQREQLYKGRRVERVWGLSLVLSDAGRQVARDMRSRWRLDHRDPMI